MDKIYKALVTAMELTGVVILEENYNGFIIGRYEDDELLISEPQFYFDNELQECIPVEHTRFEFEQTMMEYFLTHPDVNCRVMFNIAQLWIFGENRGVLRHVINWPNANDIKCRWDIVEVNKEED